MMYYSDFYPFHMFGFGAFINIIFWLVLIFLIVAIVRRREDRGESSNNHSSMDILKERYAKGEINKEQFESMKRDLM